MQFSRFVIAKGFAIPNTDRETTALLFCYILQAIVNFFLKLIRYDTTQDS